MDELRTAAWRLPHGRNDRRRAILSAAAWLALLAFATQAYLGDLRLEFFHRAGIHAVKRMGGQCAAEAFGTRGLCDEIVYTARLSRVQLESFDGLEQLRRFPALRKVHLEGSSIGDADLRHLGGLAQLTYLDLSETDVGDDGLRFVGTLAGLEKLDAWETNVTDAGLRHLAGCRPLKDLWLDGCRVIGGGFESLVESSVAVLSLKESELTDLTQIARMKWLRELEASGCRLDDESLAPLRAAPRLAILYLEGIPLTDACLPHLAAMPRLESVSLKGTLVTAAGIRQLQHLRPELSIDAPDLPPLD